MITQSPHFTYTFTYGIQVRLDGKWKTVTSFAYVADKAEAQAEADRRSASHGSRYRIITDVKKVAK